MQAQLNNHLGFVTAAGTAQPAVSVGSVMAQLCCCFALFHSEGSLTIDFCQLMFGSCGLSFTVEQLYSCSGMLLISLPLFL